MHMKSVSIDSTGRVFLDGEELPNVTEYRLEGSASNADTTELTVKMLVTIGRVASELGKK